MCSYEIIDAQTASEWSNCDGLPFAPKTIPKYWLTSELRRTTLLTAFGARFVHENSMEKKNVKAKRLEIDVTAHTQLNGSLKQFTHLLTEQIMYHWTCILCTEYMCNSLCVDTLLLKKSN